VHPVALRKGLRLFDDAEPAIPLALPACTPFKSGTVHLVYGPGEGPQPENQDPVAQRVATEYESK
jgi:hypothetical protein